MKVKLLRRLRRIGRDEVTIYSVTSGSACGMRYGYNSDDYAGLYSYGDTANDVREKACHIYMDKNIENIRKRYKKYSRKHKQSKKGN